METQYATIGDLGQLALTARAVEGIADADLNAALLAASSVADTYLAARNETLPLTTWPIALRLNVCRIAAWQLMCAIGFSPEDGSQVAIKENYDAAVKWFEALASGKVSLAAAETSPARGTTPTVYSDDSRGF